MNDAVYVFASCAAASGLLGIWAGATFWHKTAIDLAMDNQKWAAEHAERERKRAMYWRRLWMTEVGPERAAAHLAALDTCPELETADD